MVVEHAEATIRSEKADWDFESGQVTFTGSPIVSLPQLKELRGEKFVFDFNTGRYTVVRADAKGAVFGGSGEGGASSSSSESKLSLLRESDILDWPAFLKTFKAQAKETQPSPGKRIMELVSQKARKLISDNSAETLMSNKAGVLKELNSVLTKPTFYQEAAWKGIGLSEQTQAMISTKPATTDEAVKLNRALLTAAYPGLVAPLPTAESTAKN